MIGHVYACRHAYIFVRAYMHVCTLMHATLNTALNLGIQIAKSRYYLYTLGLKVGTSYILGSLE